MHAQRFYTLSLDGHIMPISDSDQCRSMAVQDVVLPKEHCDDRVEILQADARELDVRQLFTKSEVRCLPKRV